MLSHVELSNYRGFKSYKMDGLTRVNLLVGKNNSGKTGILEGIQFLTSGGDPSVLSEVADRRGEVIFNRPESGVLVDITHFFHRHALGADASFTISGDNGHHPIVVKIFNQTESSGADQGRRPSRPSGLYLKIVRNPKGHDRDEPQFRISREGGVDFEVGPRYRRLGMSRKTDGPQVRFVGPDSLNSIDLAVMWDEVALTGQEANVAEAMRILDDKVASLNFLTGMFASGYFPSRGGIVVGLNDQEGRFPLGSMGDGMRRIMALATSLAFTRDGCLFVDEIDTGLHYSVMSDMWKLVVTKAISSNIQIFATTHSWDCIEGLSKLCQSDPTLMPHISIHKVDSAIPHGIAFSGESVVRMLKSDIDPR